MHKTKKVILAIIFLFILNMTNVKAQTLPEIKNEKTGYRVVVEDDANLLTNDELNKLQDEMFSLTEYGNIAFKTISSNSTTTKSFAASYYSKTFSETSGTLFLIDMDNRIIYIHSDGSNYSVITNDKAYIITDNIYQYATKGEYYKCAVKAFSQIKTLLEGGKISEPMRYISNFLIAITISFFINFIIVLINTRNKGSKIKGILSNCIINFNIGEVTAYKTGTHKVYSPQSSSSGGSSGGGGFSGGGSSGGGGGHRF